MGHPRYASYAACYELRFPNMGAVFGDPRWIMHAANTHHTRRALFVGWGLFGSDAYAPKRRTGFRMGATELADGYSQ
jgi:hypothetical protein